MDWPEGTRAAQRSWIGRSHGATVHFQVEGRSENITVFTTRAETLMGVTYVVLAPEHPMARELATPEQKAEVEAFLNEAAAKLEKDRKVADSKAGVKTGSFAVHPLTGEKVPIWIADYVLSGYGTGAVMAVPAHDERDFAFAARHRLPVKRVITAGDATEELPFTGEGVAVDSGKFSGMTSQDCRKAITDELTKSGKGCAEVAYRLRDWVRLQTIELKSCVVAAVERLLIDCIYGCCNVRSSLANDTGANPFRCTSQSRLLRAAIPGAATSTPSTTRPRSPWTRASCR